MLPFSTLAILPLLIGTPAASVSHDMQSAIEMMKLPPVRPTARPGAAYVSG
jgi:hypothetical protein